MSTLTVKKMFELQWELSSTQRQVPCLLSFDRKNFTLFFVPPYLPRMMKLRSYTLSHLFMSATMHIEQKKRTLSETIIVETF